MVVVAVVAVAAKRAKLFWRISTVIRKLRINHIPVVLCFFRSIDLTVCEMVVLLLYLLFASVILMFSFIHLVRVNFFHRINILIFIPN